MSARHPLDSDFVRDQLVARGKPIKLAIVAAARKLLTMLNAMIRDGTDFAATA